MRRFFCSVLLLFASSLLLFHESSLEGSDVIPNKMSSSSQVKSWQYMYDTMHMDSIVSPRAFALAFAGYNKIVSRKKDILTLIDFSKPSNEERLFVIDMKNCKILFSTVVAHGKNSGDRYANSFSNKYGSYKSSLGFYLTNETYNGNNGYSLRLDGLEKGVNDNARQRAIVVHGASYANPSIAHSGRLGRSFGCPAIPTKLTRSIIDTIKGGSVLFIYAPQQDYLAKSNILSKEDVML